MADANVRDKEAMIINKEWGEGFEKKKSEKTNAGLLQRKKKYGTMAPRQTM